MKCSMMGQIIRPQKNTLTRSYLCLKISFRDHVFFRVTLIISNITTRHLHCPGRRIINLNPSSPITKRIDIIAYIIRQHLVDPQS